MSVGPTELRIVVALGIVLLIGGVVAAIVAAIETRRDFLRMRARHEAMEKRVDERLARGARWRG